MMDRERKDELPQMQVGFIDVVCRPLYTTLSESFPWIKPLLDGCLANREKWADLAEKVSLITLFEKLNIFSLSKGYCLGGIPQLHIFFCLISLSGSLPRTLSITVESIRYLPTIRAKRTQRLSHEPNGIVVVFSGNLLGRSILERLSFPLNKLGIYEITAKLPDGATSY